MNQIHKIEKTNKEMLAQLDDFDGMKVIMEPILNCLLLDTFWNIYIHFCFRENWKSKTKS